MTRVTQGMVPGMAWLSGTGPEGTTCKGCAHVAVYTRCGSHVSKVTCPKSKPIKGKFQPFAAASASCHHYAFIGEGRR